MFDLFKLILIATFFCGASAAIAADGPVTIVVPYTPGGFVDNVARALAGPLSTALKQPVLILNRPGANGDIGHAAVANAPGDGRTFLLAAPSLAAQPAIDALSGKRSAYALESLVPIAQITSDPAVFLVHPSLRVKTVNEYVKLARTKPLGLSVSSSGTYGATHLPIAMLEMQTGIKLLHVPTAGGSQAITMALGGHTTAVAAAPGVAGPHIKSGNLIALAQSGQARVASLADVPTFKESGIDVEFSLWTALFTSARTPQAQLTELRIALRQAVSDDNFRSNLASAQTNFAYVDGEAFKIQWQKEIGKLQATVRHIGKVDAVN